MGMDIFWKRVVPPQGGPQVGPSGDIPEAIVIIGNDGSMGVIAPENLPVA